MNNWIICTGNKYSKIHSRITKSFFVFNFFLKYNQTIQQCTKIFRTVDDTKCCCNCDRVENYPYSPLAVPKDSIQVLFISWFCTKRVDSKKKGTQLIQILKPENNVNTLRNCFKLVIFHVALMVVIWFKRTAICTSVIG